MSAGRPPLGWLPDTLVEGGPDLAVEVLSPSNRAGEMKQKGATCQSAGDHERAVAGMVPGGRRSQAPTSLTEKLAAPAPRRVSV